MGGACVTQESDEKCLSLHKCNRQTWREKKAGELFEQMCWKYSNWA